jgi:hypothetical protein
MRDWSVGFSLFQKLEGQVLFLLYELRSLKWLLLLHFQNLIEDLLLLSESGSFERLKNLLLLADWSYTFDRESGLVIGVSV